MRVSLTWIGILLIAIFLAFVGIYGYNEFSSESENSEGFQNSAPLEDDIQEIDTCPAKSNRYVDSTGQVMCCDGEVQNNQCRGKTICSLSEGTTLTPKCGVWFSAYLNEKGRGRCPPSMPNYFESVDGSKKGCCTGRRNKSGSGPLQTSQKKCNLYGTQQQEEGLVDSCTNQKLLETSICFRNNTVRVEKSLIPVWNGKLPAQVQCNFGDVQSRTAGTCITNDSMERFFTRIFQMFGINGAGWKESTVNWDPIEKLNFCSVAEQYKILKTIGYKDLPKAKVY